MVRPQPPAQFVNQAVQISTDSLKSVRTTATNWATTVSALVGISTITALLKGSDTLSKLSLATQILYAVSFFLTLALAVTAAYYAAIASQGTPDYDFNDPISVLEENTRNIEDAKNQLQRSRCLAIVAVVFLFLTLFFSSFDLFGSGTPDTSTSVLVVQKSGSVICGTLTKDNNGSGSLTVNGNPLNNVVSVVVVSSCPSK
jgi:hypothetical protein